MLELEAKSSSGLQLQAKTLVPDQILCYVLVKRTLGQVLEPCLLITSNKEEMTLPVSTVFSTERGWNRGPSGRVPNARAIGKNLVF